MESNFTKLMYAFGSQLYKRDILLYDEFEKIFNHNYVTLSYYDEESKNKVDEIQKLINSFSINDLLLEIIKISDYSNLFKIKWVVNSCIDKKGKYNFIEGAQIDFQSIKKEIVINENKLKFKKLDSFRKSEIKEIHNHYWFWINRLMCDESTNFSMWVFEYNDTLLFNMFHLSNNGDKRLSNIILKYITDNNIIPDQSDMKESYKIIHPFVKNITFEYSGDIGGFYYKIYLTAKELKDIYKTIGYRNSRKLGCNRFFAYINMFKNNNELDRKFYFYFKS